MYLNKTLIGCQTGDKIKASRRQIPLNLAWAITVHKSQGMTLDRVEMDLARAFGPGMVYVALSRASSLDGLSLASFDKALIKASPIAIQFMNQVNGSISKPAVSTSDVSEFDAIAIDNHVYDSTQAIDVSSTPFTTNTPLTGKRKHTEESSDTCKKLRAI